MFFDIGMDMTILVSPGHRGDAFEGKQIAQFQPWLIQRDPEWICNLSIYIFCCINLHAKCQLTSCCTGTGSEKTLHMPGFVVILTFDVDESGSKQ